MKLNISFVFSSLRPEDLEKTCQPVVDKFGVLLSLSRWKDRELSTEKSVNFTKPMSNHMNHIVNKRWGLESEGRINCSRMTKIFTMCIMCVSSLQEKG